MKTAVLLMAMGLSGCVSQSTLLVNAEGKAVSCNNQGWGWIGAPVAMHQHSACVKRAQAAGYTVPEPKP